MILGIHVMYLKDTHSVFLGHSETRKIKQDIFHGRENIAVAANHLALYHDSPDRASKIGSPVHVFCLPLSNIHS